MQSLREEDYPVLAAIWNNEEDDIYDTNNADTIVCIWCGRRVRQLSNRSKNYHKRCYRRQLRRIKP